MPTAEATDLSIVIVSWNTEQLLRYCLQSIHEVVSGLQAEVLVVDNASDDNSVRMVRQCFPTVRLLTNKDNLGFAAANNRALYCSRARYIVLLNSDTVVCAGALQAMVRFMDVHPDAGGCGPRLINPDGSLQRSCYPLLTPGREFWRLIFLDLLWHRATYTQERWDWNSPRTVEVVKGACFMLRRTALDQVGVLDEQYFMYTEEMDLCYRLREAGWELWWVPQAVVVHYGEASAKQMAEAMYIQLYRSKAQFHHKFGGPRQADRFKRLMRLAYAPRLAFATLAAPFSPALAARRRTYRRLLAELRGM